MIRVITACARPESHARVENKQRGTLWLVLLLPPTLPLHNGIHTHCQLLVLISKRSVPSHTVSRRPLELLLPHISPSCSPPDPSKRPPKSFLEPSSSCITGRRGARALCFACMYMSVSSARQQQRRPLSSCRPTPPQASLEARKNSITMVVVRTRVPRAFRTEKLGVCSRCHPRQAKHQ
jgi:hypothetical protein